MIAEMGVFLLLGFAISALLHHFLRQAWVEGLMGKRNIASIIWGSVVGVPMPLCSCGVIPVTMSLRDKGASKGATVSFLTSTPQTGVDSFLATYGMLGGVFAIYKIAVAFISGILVGLSVELFVSNHQAPKPMVSDESLTPTATPQPSWSQSGRYGFFTMPGDLSQALLIGFVIAGLISALAPEDLLADIPGGALSAILLATVISVPFYICSTGSIPLALALVHSGLPVSAALVLLIAGPATNVATITTMRKVLGGKTTVIYVAGVILATWIAAAVYHVFLDTGALGHHGMAHEMDLPLWKHLGGAALLSLLIFPYIKSKFGSRQTTTIPMNPELNLQTATIHVVGMTCSHCESSVVNGLKDLPFTENVLSVDRNANTAVIQGNDIEEPVIRQKIESLGFEYRGVEIG